MIKASELIGKKLVCLNTAGIVGTVVDIVFDPKIRTGKLLRIFSEDETEPEIQYVELKRVKAFEFDACVIADKSAVTYTWNTRIAEVQNPINCDCFNQSGKFLGRVRDLTLEGCAVQSVLVEDTELAPALLLSYSGKTLIFNDTGAPVKLTKHKAHAFRNTAAQTVSVHRAQDAAAADDLPARDLVSLPARVPPHNTLVSRSPAKEPGGGVYAFLLGKTLSRALTDDSGAVLVEKQSGVTEDVIQTARAHGKLVQLALYAD